MTKALDDKILSIAMIAWKEGKTGAWTKIQFRNVLAIAASFIPFAGALAFLNIMKLNKTFFKKFLPISGGFVVVLLAIFAFVYTYLNISWGNELRGELDKIKTAVRPMSVSEITPPPLSTERNTMIEYQQIFAILTDGTFSATGSGEKNKIVKELE